MPPLLDDLRQRFKIATSVVRIDGWQFEMFRPENSDDLISEDDFDRDGRLPYWAEIWPSAQALAGKIAAQRGEGRRLLELGGGVGLVALAAVRAGFNVVASDYYQEALEFTEVNAQHNGLPPPECRLVDWRRFPDDLGDFDLVVAADVLFEKPNIPLVAAAFARTIRPGGRGWVTDPDRPFGALFAAECEKSGLAIVDRHEIPVAKPDKPAPQMIKFYELQHDTAAPPHDRTP